ncbi:branched-chain amino acid ABC transporter permease [Aureimonas endophytica]|uniref:Branched-chain amino acid ABC transporter permease n=1 Tax=Aureimonas endophytica TaxID=2027858 RepID=A0A917E737_9HYPH|nr:branched-chain amino acid ABC transporter permease [Aureimonas endophytica]GGE11259.1 branched-chain amino acid ABC transporter permease [Aureimonas endophytica]
MSATDNALAPAGGLDLAPRALRALALLVALLALFGLVPLAASDYWLSSILIPALVMGLAGIGLNLLMGYAGLVSIGSAAFMSVGAFATYNLLLRAPFLPLPVVLVLAGLIAAAAGTLFGLPALRIKGFYLGASTLGAQFFFEWLFTNYAFFSNNSQSLTISAPRLEFLGFDLQSATGRYLLAAGVGALLVAFAFALVRSRVGREWMAIRDMETASAVIGLPVARRKLQAYAASSFFLGIVGALWAFAYLGTADGHAFNLDKSFQILFIVLIGGTATILGNFLGAAFIVLTPILLDRLAGSSGLGLLSDPGAAANLQHIVFGAIIILLLVKEPDGLSALIVRAARRLRRPAA